MHSSHIIASIVSPEILVLAGLIVLVFGGSQLPKLAKNIGLAKKELENVQKESKPNASEDNTSTKSHT